MQLDFNFNVVKTCSKCKQDKAAEDFSKNHAWCKECQKEYKKAYRKQNAEKIKAYYKQNAEKIKAYRKQNREKIRERQKAYHKQNRDKKRIYKRNRHKTDINFKLRGNLRSGIRRVLKGKSKSKKTMDLIGCSADFLKKHLENQFQPGMSWNNYGNPNGDHSECWHIDHILPCASFDLSDPKQQQKCFHYSNLQPLWAKDNISKGAKIN